MNVRNICRMSLFCSTLFASSFVASAQEYKALVGGRLIDGFGHQPLANSVILIKDNDRRLN